MHQAIMARETKELDKSLGCNDIKIVKNDLLKSIIEDDLTSHTSTTASLDSMSLDSKNDKYVSYYIPKKMVNYEPLLILLTYQSRRYTTLSL